MRVPDSYCAIRMSAVFSEKPTMLDTIPDNLFHRSERKAIEERIAGIERQIDLARAGMETIPKQHGYKDVKSAEAAYKAAKAVRDSLRAAVGKTDETGAININSGTQKQKVSVLKELAARRLEIQQREAERRNLEKSKNRGSKEI